MARLVPFSLGGGRVIDIRGERYTCTASNPGSTALTLVSQSNGKSIQISRNELMSLIVMEEARLCDELEEPDLTPSRQCTDISGLSIARMLDWQLKLFLCRNMIPQLGRSPKSSEFRQDYALVTGILMDLYSVVGLRFQWSAWTVYHDLLRWRAKGYDVSALQRKGVEYTPWKDESKVRSNLARELIDEILADKPNLSSAGIYRELKSRIRRGAQEMEK